MGWMNLIVGFLRLGPLALGVIALAVMGGGLYLQVGQNERNAQKLAALEAGPPPAVSVTKFDRDQHMTSVREVVIRAQPLMEYAYRLTLEGSTSDEYAYMVPLISENSADTRVIFGVALYTSNSFTFDDITPDLMLDGFVDFGPVSAIVDFNGRLSSLGDWAELTDEAFEIEGLTMAASPVIMRPYLEGREAALTPSETTIFDLLSKVAAGIALLALGKLVIRNRDDEAPDAPAAPVHMAAATPGYDTFEATAVAQPTSYAAPPTPDPQVPLWKQRVMSGPGALSSHEASTDVMEDVATPYEPVQPAPVQPALVQPGFAPSQPAPETVLETPKRRFTLRSALIGVVGLAFLVMLGAVIAGLLQQSRANDQTAALPTVEERIADFAANAIVPEADPNRHWTDIDIGPMVEWVLAKAMLAVAGDTNAMMILAAIILTPIILLMIFKFYLSTRRRFTPGVSARIDSMGLN